MDLSTLATTAGSFAPGPWGTGLKIAGALGGLFGGGVNNDAYNAAKQNAGNNAGQLSGIRDWYATRANQQGANYGVDNGLARTAAGTLEKYYQTDPTNDSAYARDLSRADGGLHANIARAQFENLENAGNNGSMVPGGGLSGSGHGINAYLSAIDALGTSSNQIQVAGQNQQRRVANMQDEYGLTSGMANQDYSNAGQATGQEGDLTKSLMDWYQGQEQNALGQAQTAGNAAMGGLSGEASNIGSNLSSLYSVLNRRKPAPAPTAGTSNVNLPSGYGLNIPAFGG
jgi:hypothetical protein